MPAGVLYGTRTKYIHSVGATGKVVFRRYQSKAQYSGIFEGADHGFIRLSTASKSSNSQAMAPGMGLKFLRNGVDSANLVAMYSLNGQPGEWNYFAHDFSNHIGFPGKSLAFETLGRKFATATDMIFTVGLSNWGQFDQAGNYIANPSFPWKLRFAPHPDVQNSMPST